MIHEICIKFAYNLAFPQEKNYRIRVKTFSGGKEGREEEKTRMRLRFMRQAFVKR